jgi:dTDP-4-dehydrorhamnose reductase
MSAQPVVLVLGSSGQVGFELVRSLMGLGKIVAPGRDVISLERPDSIRACVASVAPSIIVNAAAYTAVDQAESEPALANAINAEAPAILAECANQVNAALVHYSTDYVFDGSRALSAQSGYAEDDPTNPLNVYGQSKLAGEKAITQIAQRHLIFRTSWVYGLRGKNFLLTMLRLARQRSELTVVADQLGAPTWSRTIATLTAHVLAQQVGARAAQQEWWQANSGIYHLTAGGRTSWADFASAIFADAIEDAAQRPSVVPIASADYPSKVVRPQNSTLSGRKLEDTFGLRAPDWRDALTACVQGMAVEGQ